MDIQWLMPPRGQILPPPQPGMGYWPPPPGAEPRGGAAGAMAPPKAATHTRIYIYSLNFVCLNIYTLNFV
jgi:hypothetical protein